jgi:hypothetical protein
LGLTDQQIERYARQIIVPGIGGIAQERWLASRMMLAGAAADIASVLAYLAGAGVGEIHLMLPVGDRAGEPPLIRRARELNPDVVVAAATDVVAGLNLVVAIDGNSENPVLMGSWWAEAFARESDNDSLKPVPHGADVPLIAVHLDEPASIAIFTAHPPCPRCAELDLPLRATRRGENAGFVAMVAATEALKLLARSAPVPPSTLLQFTRFECAVKPLRQKPLTAKCVCSYQQ